MSKPHITAAAVLAECIGKAFPELTTPEPTEPEPEEPAASVFD